jgi:hypothetical protein
MPKYVIERSVNGVGGLAPEKLGAISRKSCDVLAELGSEIQWVHSYVTANRPTASTSPPTRRPSASTQGAVAFLPIAYPRSRQ